ncbi:MAG: SulP family inorganic anion transporter [Alphaproteobacteria bacterium]|nr:SulP family inorganic anion transporter [Alphaproteobacteria bacterium]
MLLQFIHGFDRNNLKGDIFGGIMSAIVALPLALAFGVTTGAGPVAGLYSAILIGFFSALFGGTPAHVSGPTVPTAILMTGFLAHFSGNPAAAFTMVILAGIFQISFGALKLGKYAAFVPFSVISGFMSGVGVLVIILQIPSILGYAHIIHEASSSLTISNGMLSSPNAGALTLGGITLFILLFTPKVIRKWLPPTFVALVVGTLLSIFFLPEVPVLGEIPRSLPKLTMPTFGIEDGDLLFMLEGAMLLAALGSIDTLLTSLIADNMTRTQHSSNKELIGQGIGNVAAGLFGGLPGSGATMRTIVNVRAGGRSALSGMLHSVLLLSVMMGLGVVVEKIPTAVLAGILIKVGLDVIDWGFIRRIPRAPFSGVLVMVVVASLTIFADLMVAVALGVIMSHFISASSMSEHQMKSLKIISGSVEENTDHLSAEEKWLLKSGGILFFHLSGAFSFCSATAMSRIFANIGIGNYRVMLFDLSDVPMVDISIAMSIENLMKRAENNGLKVLISGLGSQGLETLERLRILDNVPEKHRFETKRTALIFARTLVDKWKHSLTV